jgi:hypothetical protein
MRKADYSPGIFDRGMNNEDDDSIIEPRILSDTQNIFYDKE